MNNQNKVVEILRQGNIAFGTFVFLPEPAIVEMIGNAGYDFIIFDMEHAPLGTRDIETLARSAELSGTVPFVRISKNKREDILNILDTGVMGVMISHIISSNEVSKIVEAVKYPPIGKRGICGGVRGTRYGDIDLVQHINLSNVRTWVIALIEDEEGCNNIDEILSVKGLNAVCLGPGDLAMSLEIPGQVTHPKVTEMIEKVIDAAKNKGIPVAMYIYEISKSEEWVKKGVNLIIYYQDTRILMDAYKNSIIQLRTLSSQAIQSKI